MESWHDPRRGDEANLHAEIDDLRQQVQTLRARLVASQNKSKPRIGYELLRALWRTCRRLVTRLQARPPAAARDDRAHFRPYRARVTHAGPAGGRRRVLHVLPDLVTGGSARLVVDLIEHLGADWGHRVVSRAAPGEAEYVGLDVWELGDLSGPTPARTAIRAYRPDLVHVHYVAEDPRTWWGEADWRWYHHVMTAAEEEGCRVVENVNIPVPPYVSEAVSAYVYVSEFVKRRFARTSDRNEVIYPGSDTALFTRRRDVSYPDDCIGMVYRLEGDKLDDRSIDPFIEVVRRRPQTRALIIGGGGMRDEFRAAVRRAGLEGAIEFPGFVAYEDLPDWYSRLALVIAPVIRESFGHVTPLAMSMELPVAGYAVGAIPEIVGDEALLAAPGDAAALAGIVVELLDDRERRLEIGRRNRARAEQLFSLPAMIERYQALYRAVVGLSSGMVGREVA